MDGCLACKSCVGQCPIKVDVPAFRSRFLEVYYGRYLRPAKDRLVARLEARAAAGGAGAAPGERADAQPAGPPRVRAASGLVALPELDAIDLRAALAQRGVRMATPSALARAARGRTRARAWSWCRMHSRRTTTRPSCSTSASCCSGSGSRPWLAPFRPNGKPQHVLGLLRAVSADGAPQCRHAEGAGGHGREPRRRRPFDDAGLSRRVRQGAREGSASRWSRCRRSGLPSGCDELPHWTPSEATVGRCCRIAPSGRMRLPPPRIGSRSARRLGVDLQIVASGCCGMAGLYGHERANRPTSEAIYGLSWGPILADARHAGRTLATGYSCRCQANLVDGLQLMHPVQLLLRVLEVRPCRSHRASLYRCDTRRGASRRVLTAERRLLIVVRVPVNGTCADWASRQQRDRLWEFAGAQRTSRLADATSRSHARLLQARRRGQGQASVGSFTAGNPFSAVDQNPPSSGGLRASFLLRSSLTSNAK